MPKQGVFKIHPGILEVFNMNFLSGKKKIGFMCGCVELSVEDGEEDGEVEVFA